MTWRTSRVAVRAACGIVPTRRASAHRWMRSIDRVDRSRPSSRVDRVDRSRPSIARRVRSTRSRVACGGAQWVRVVPDHDRSMDLIRGEPKTTTDPNLAIDRIHRSWTARVRGRGGGRRPWSRLADAKKSRRPKRVRRCPGVLGSGVWGPIDRARRIDRYRASMDDARDRCE